METQTLYQKTILFAAEKHKDQKVPGTDLTYLIHLSDVAMEILIACIHSRDLDPSFAVQLALLHDTIEDTHTTFEEIKNEFGVDVALGVDALSKKDFPTKNESMKDSLKRIKQQPKEVWAVKLADRITNLQKPPVHWTTEKKISYMNEAELILKELSGGNEYLENRLLSKINDYEHYIQQLDQN